MKSVKVRVVRIEAVCEAPSIVSTQLLLSILIHLNLAWIDDWKRWTWCKNVLSQTFLDNRFTFLIIFDVFKCTSDIEKVNLMFICLFHNINLNSLKFLHSVGIAFGKYWYHICIFLDCLNWNKILVFWVMTIEEKQDQMNSRVHYLFKTTWNHLRISFVFKVYFLASIPIFNHPSFDFAQYFRPPFLQTDFLSIAWWINNSQIELNLILFFFWSQYNLLKWLRLCSNNIILIIMNVLVSILKAIYMVWLQAGLRALNLLLTHWHLLCLYRL